MVRQVLGRLRYINSMTILTWPPRQIQFVSAHARIGKGVSSCYINGILNRIIDFSFDLEMRRLKETFRRRSPVPPVPAEGFRSSTSSDALASVIKGLDVTETAVGGLPILGLVKPAISTIRTVLQSVVVKIILIGYISDRDYLMQSGFS